MCTKEQLIMYIDKCVEQIDNLVLTEDETKTLRERLYRNWCSELSYYQE